MALIVLDTDVASLSYKGQLSESMARALLGHTLCVTFVTVGEMARWADSRQWGPRKRTELVAWLGNRVVLPYDANVAWRWGQLIAAAERRGRPRPINDTWIAACCLAAELPLATLNIKDYLDYTQHEGLRLVPGSASS
ncbi:MAG: type II toxin-antitoxin system VapC family toxin [Sciscionella sp.]